MPRITPRLARDSHIARAILFFTAFLLVGCCDKGSDQPTREKDIEITNNPSTTRQNTVRYGQYDYELSKERSSLEGFIDTEGSTLTWGLEIYGVDTDAYDGTDAPCYPPFATAGLGSEEVSNWRELVGVSCEEPDPDGETVYVGYHQLSTRYQVDVLDRRGSEFLVRAQWDADETVVAYGWVPFTGVLVRLDHEKFGNRIKRMMRDEELDPHADDLSPSPERDRLYADMVASASHTLRIHCAIEDFDKPEVRKLMWVWFPLKKTATGD